LDGSVAVNFPIIEGVLAGKVAFSHRGRDGFYTNLYDGEDISHINSSRLRGYLLWTPSDDLRVTLVSELQRIRNGTDVLHPLSYPGQVFYRPNTPVDFDVYIDVPDQNHVNASSHTLTADWNTGIGQVTSITNYSKWNRHAFQDVDGINCFCFASFSRDYGWQMSQELRNVFHPTDNLEILVGGFAQAWAYASNNISVTAFASPTSFGRTRINQRTENLAAFTQAYWDVTDRLRVQGGLRVSYETVRLYRANIAYTRPAGTSPTLGFGNLVGAIQLPLSTVNFPSQGRESWTNLGGKIGVDYKVSDDIMTYGYYARGFKSGGFNGRVTQAQDIGPYDPEFVDSFEVGVKSDWLDNRLRLNVAAFLNKWEDMQVTQSVYRGDPPVAASVILNAGKSTTKGVEFEGEFVPIEGLRINASLGYLKAVYDEFRSGTGPTCPPLPAPQPAQCSVDYSGRPLMYSPKWNGSLGATYTFPLAGGEASASAQYTYTAKKWGNYTQSPSERLPSVSLVNAAVSWSPANANWSISAWGRNLFDKRYVAMALDVPPLFTEGVLGNPRQFGIDFDFKF
jgi:iron complex outermembrane receptor protein